MNLSSSISIRIIIEYIINRLHKGGALKIGVNDALQLFRQPLSKGSETAKNGIEEERKVRENLKNPDIREALSPILGNKYDQCLQLGGQAKTDIKSKNNILKAQVKKCKNGRFQQLDRHSINHVIKNIPLLNEVSQILRDLIEYPLLANEKHIDKSFPLKKLNLQNYTQKEINNFLAILNKNVEPILRYAFLGQDIENQPDYVIAVEYDKNKKRDSIIAFRINDAIKYLKKFKFTVSSQKTCIYLGTEGIISIQRKGGDCGKKSSNDIQIKIKPCELIEKIPHSKYKL
jgi:hypothetical protein